MKDYCLSIEPNYFVAVGWLPRVEKEKPRAHMGHTVHQRSSWE